MSDDDPLSELARIVGYDARPASQQLAELKKHQETLAERPAFDLEAELLAEFDNYAEPSRTAAAQAVEAVEAIPEPAAVPLIAVEEPWPFKDAAGSDQPEPLTVVAPVEAPAVAPVPTAAYADYDVSDLERELELSIQAAEATDEGFHIAHADPVDAFIEGAVAEPVGSPEVVYAEAVAPEAEIETVSETIVAEQALVQSEPVPVEVVPEVFEQVAAAEPVHQAVITDAIESSPVSIEPIVQAVPVASNAPIDKLLAEVERFPVPQPTRGYGSSLAQPAGQRKSAYPFVPTFGRATPTAAAGSMATIRPMEPPVVVPPVAVVEPDVIESVVPELPAAAITPEVSVLPEAEPEFDLDNFELDLSDMELELDPADLDLTTQETLSIHPDGADIADPPAFAYAAAWDGARAQDDADVETDAYFEQEPFEPIEQEPIESVLHFDPSMISETDEAVSHLAELDIPQLPPVEQDRPTVQEPDYDLDIDAEMAHLFDASRSRPAVIDIKAPVETIADTPARFIPVAHGRAQPASNAADFEEFERVMEEDFRRSLRERQEGDLSVERLPLQPGFAQADDPGENRQRRRRVLALAACVAGIALLGGAGVYAFMGSSIGGTTSGAPKIILADKDPIKVVPIEKGGKTVPNQDKAVYDRVAGATQDNPQQEALVSSTEEPVDVVQRTLTPENLPMEGAEDFEPTSVATPVDAEESARLFPEESTTVAANEDKTPAVSPRKVKTMIVKPDGTLVAREEPVVEPDVPAATATTTLPETASAQSLEDEIQAPLSEIQTPVVEAEPADTALRTTPESDTPPVTDTQPTAIEDVANADVGETAPVRTVTTTAVSTPVLAETAELTTEVTTNAPVPQSRPADQPVNVVGTVSDQGNVTTPATSRVVAEDEMQQPTAEVASVQSKPVAAGSYVVQIASLPSEAEAQRSYNSLSGKFSGVIGGRGVDIRKAEITGKGTYYRVRIPAGSREEANSLCSKLKSAGGTCLVTK